jgi:hypothetical protein
MSVSARTAQQPLGYGPLGAALVVIAMAIVLAVAFAFGQFGAAKTDVTPAAVGAPPPVVIDHGWSQAGTSTGVGAPPAAIDHGSSEGSMVGPYDGTGYTGDPGLAPRPGQDAKGSGSNGPRLRPQ